MTKRMQNGGVVKMVEDADVEFHKQAGWKLLGIEPQPSQEVVEPVAEKIVSLKSRKKKA